LDVTAEAAAATGLSEATVKVTVHQGLKALLAVWREAMMPRGAPMRTMVSFQGP
jgi:hypothetical protein